MSPSQKSAVYFSAAFVTQIAEVAVCVLLTGTPINMQIFVTEIELSGGVCGVAAFGESVADIGRKVEFARPVFP